MTSPEYFAVPQRRTHHPLRAGIYVRQPGRQGTDYEQEAACWEFCRAHGYSVVQVFADTGVAGYLSAGWRPALAEMCDQVEAGALDVVVALDTSRLTRSPVDLYRLLGHLEQARVALELVR